MKLESMVHSHMPRLVPAWSRDERFQPAEGDAGAADSSWPELVKGPRNGISPARQTLVVQADSLRQPMADALLLMADTLHRGCRIVFFGNGLGGMVGRMLADAVASAVPPLPSQRNRSPSALALDGADDGAPRNMAHQLRLRGRRGDCAVALSASGRSPNVLSAMLAAHDLGMVNVALLGQAGQAAALADVAVVCGHDDPARVHEMQLLLGHLLCGRLARALQVEG